MNARCAVFISAAEIDVMFSRNVVQGLHRCGAATFVDEATISDNRYGTESGILGAISAADEMLVMVARSSAFHNSFGPPDSFQRRFIWLALGVAVARGIPIKVLLCGMTEDNLRADPKIPDLIKKCEHVYDSQNLDPYLEDVRERIRSGISRRLPPPDAARIALNLSRDPSVSVSKHRYNVLLCHDHAARKQIKPLGEALEKRGLATKFVTAAEIKGLIKRPDQLGLEKWPYDDEMDRWHYIVKINLDPRIHAIAVFVGDGPYTPWEGDEKLAIMFRYFAEKERPLFLINPPAEVTFDRATHVRYEKKDVNSLMPLVWGSTGYKFSANPNSRPPVTPRSDGTSPPRPKRFRIALSFAGQRRKFVADTAAVLAKQFGENAILYDKYHEAEFARENLGFYLPNLYHDDSDLVVVVICPDYETKEWCGLEWRAIFDLLKKRQSKDIMFCRFEHATVPGLYSTAGYVELDDKTSVQAAALILDRLALNEGKPKSHYAPNPQLSKHDSQEPPKP